MLFWDIFNSLYASEIMLKKTDKEEIKRAQ